MRIFAKRIAVVTGILLLAIGCAKSPPPTFYLLATAEPEQRALAKAGLAVGVGPIELPPHLDRNQIASRAAPTRLDLSERHHWAEPLQAGFTRVLVSTLGRELSSNQVYAQPTRRQPDLDYQVAVDVFRLDGELGQDVTLRARWTLLDGDGRRILRSQLTQIREPIEGSGHAGLVAALSSAVARLGREIGGAIEAARAVGDG